MTSKGVNSLCVVTSSELKAMLKLVQRTNDVSDARERWLEDCMTAFGWSRETALHICNHNLRRMAVRELPNVD